MGYSEKEQVFDIRARYLSERAMAPHSSILAWKNPWTKEPGGLQSMELLRVDTTEWLHVHFSLARIGEGNGNPLRCSCLENPRDGGAWWAAIYGVAQSRTRLKQQQQHNFATSFTEGDIFVSNYVGFLKIIALPTSFYILMVAPTCCWD